MPTVPGAVGAFRRRALLQVGGLSDDTWLRTPTSPSPSGGPAGTSSTSRRPRGWTEAPRRLGQLWLQRYRWCYGTMQSMWKHRRALVDRGASGRMGRLGLLNLVLIESVLMAGSRLRWHKLHRTGGLHAELAAATATRSA